MRRSSPQSLFFILFVLIFPFVRWWQRPTDALATCGAARWTIDADGQLACGAGRPLTRPERLSLGLTVDANDLSDDDWRVLVGHTLADRLEARRARAGRICRWRLSELRDVLPEEALRRLPATLTCGGL